MMENKVLTALLVGTLCVMLPTHAERLCLTDSFEHQVETLLSYVTLSDERLNNLTQVPRDLERVLRHQWPECKILTFGSTVTGLALESSDIDCFVDIPGAEKYNPQALVNETLAILQRHPELFDRFVMRQTIRVPLLTCKHIPANITVDITVSGPIAVYSSRMMSYLLHFDQRGLDLARVLKYWGSVHDISNGKLTLPGYAIALMTIFFLQQKKILPSVAALQQNASPYDLDHWNPVFVPIEYHSDNNETLYELLGGFFKYYSDFDFRNTVISPYLGYGIKKEDFDKLEHFDTYKRNLANGYAGPFTFGYINIQDNIRHCENVARPYDVQRPSLRLIRHVKSAARMYHELSSEEFLTGLLVPEKRIAAGRLTTLWEGVGAPEDCIMTHRKKVT